MAEFCSDLDNEVGWLIEIDNEGDDNQSAAAISEGQVCSVDLSYVSRV